MSTVTDDEPSSPVETVDTGQSTEAGHTRPWVIRELLLYAELLAVTGITIAQPVLDSFRQSPDTFVYRRADSLDVVLFVFAVVFVLPAVLWLGEWLIGLVNGPTRRMVHLGFLAAFIGLMGWQLVERNTSAGLGWHLTLALALALVGALLIWRFRPTRTLLRFLALSPVLVAAQFLFTAPISTIAFGQGVGTVQGAPIDNPVPIVMLILDELPTASLLDGDGQIDETLFPNFAEFTDGATWYRNTSSVSPTTPEATPAMLTGRYPTSLGQAPVAENHPENLFSALEGAYELNVWEITTQLCPPEQCPATGGALDQGLIPLLKDAALLWNDFMDEPPTEEQQEFAIRQSDPSATDKFGRFVDSIVAEGASLDFLHVLLPHQPWWQLPGGARHDAPFLAEGLVGPDYSWESDYFSQAARQRHALQLQRGDELFGEVMDELRSSDRYDDAMIILASDHGVAFETASPIRGLSGQNVEQVMWVPLIIKTPGQTEGGIDDRPVQTIDLLPSIAEVIGLELPWPVDGTSIFGPDASGEDDDVRRLYPWKLNELKPLDGQDYVAIDGTEGFQRLLDAEPIGSEPADDLEVYRFGVWGELVGRQITDFTLGEPAGYDAQLLDKDDEDIDASYWDDVDLEDEILPVYVRGDVYTADRVDIVIAVNGIIGQWGRSFVDGDTGRRAFFGLTPQQLLADGSNTIELFEVTRDDSGDIGLRPIDLRSAS